MRALLQQKADVNAPQVDGATALHWAVYRDDLEMADLLIRAGANVKAANREGVTPLAMAALYGNAAMIDTAAEGRRRRRTSVGPNGETMLMLAARNGNPDAIKVLLEAGADVNAKETSARHDGADVGRGAEASRRPSRCCSRRAPTFARSRVRRGLPRNYMAHARELAGRRGGARSDAWRGGGRAHVPGAARVRAGERACSADELGGAARLQQRRRGRGASARRSASRGRRRAVRRRTRTRRRGRGRPAGTAAAPSDDDSDVVVAGLVGSGGGGLTALVFAAREGDLESAQAAARRRRRRQPDDRVRLDAAADRDEQPALPARRSS